MKKPFMTVAVAIALVALVFIFYGNPAVKEDQKNAPENNTAVTTADVKEFTISGKNFNFAPNTMTVKKGDRVRITLANGDGFHDLVIDEFGVATKKINTGMTDVVEFTADKAGSFEYYCSVGSHRMMGMKGTLIVQ